jgi:uncharacterized membrane protein
MRWSTPRMLAIALLATVALNLFLGSVIAGHWLRAEPRGWSAATLIERRAERLAAPDAALLRAAFAQRQADLDGRFEALRAARAAAREAVAAEPLDVDALAAALAEIRARTDATQAGFHELYLALAPQLSPAGRRALFEHPRGRK